MAELTGHAISTLGGAAEHTYVTSSDGYEWGCWGRSAGGHAICSGEGFSKEANCLSEPKSRAGIVYGITGVCHQSANRILYPAGVTVSEAKAYWASWLVYGTYGTDTLAWLARREVCQVIVPQNVESDMRSTDDEQTFMQQVLELYARQAETPPEARDSRAASEDLLGEELRLGIRYRLGEDFDPGAMEDLVAKQRDFQKMKRELDEALRAREITPEKHADATNQALAKFMAGCKAVLGPEDYERMFGVSETEVVLVDPQLALDNHS
jgi:hypothetical protein